MSVGSEVRDVLAQEELVESELVESRKVRPKMGGWQVQV